MHCGFVRLCWSWVWGCIRRGSGLAIVLWWCWPCYYVQLLLVQASGSIPWGHLKSLVVGIVLPIDSFVWRVHPFGGGRPWIGFAECPIFQWGLYQTERWIWGLNRLSSLLVSQTIDRHNLDRVGRFQGLWWSQNMEGRWPHVSICDLLWLEWRCIHDAAEGLWWDPLRFVGKGGSLLLLWYSKEGFLSSGWVFCFVGMWHILWRILLSIDAFLSMVGLLWLFGWFRHVLDGQPSDGRGLGSWGFISMTPGVL